MTQEEKAKAYDEMTRLLSNWYKNETDIDIIDHISVIYPELKESEDERIRKELIGFIENWKNSNNLGRPQDYPMFTKNEEQCNKYITWLEKQGEQKPVDEVEPKFKVGDWIVVNEFVGDAWHIDSIDKKNYRVSNRKGNYNYFSILDQDKMRLWTIQDAKDGDVLVNQNGEMPFIFSTYKENHIFCHCGYANRKNIFFDKFVDKDGSLLHWVNLFHEKVCPAAKEQRDLLFQKMEEAGYKWENNQLEEISKDFVDLGLPSGTLWSKFNLGAEKETDFGLFFQWGDTHGFFGVDERQFKWNDYKWDNSGNITKYNKTDNKLVLDNEDDPVFAATNGKFKSPTIEQLQELITHTDHEWIENFEKSGVNGMKFINKNDDTKCIFVPAAGCCGGSHHYDTGSWGYLWSASCYDSYANNAWYMYFDAVDFYMNVFSRCSGYSVRGILNK